MFLVEESGHTLLFDCPFDEGLEDYGRTYAVYQMPRLTDEDLAGSWDDLSKQAIRWLGTVPISAIEFGSDARSEVSRASLVPFVTRIGDPHWRLPAFDASLSVKPSLPDG